jgi:hypothetical protein
MHGPRSVLVPDLGVFSYAQWDSLRMGPKSKQNSFIFHIYLIYIAQACFSCGGTGVWTTAWHLPGRHSPFEPQPVLLSFIFWGRVSCFFPGWDYRHAQPPKVILYTIFVHLGVLTGTHLWGQTWNFPFISSCQHSKVWNFGVFGIFRLEMLNMYLIEIFFVCVCAAGDGTQGMEHGRQVLNHWTIPTALTGIFLMINEIDVYKTLRTVPGTHQLSYNILLHFFFCVVNWGLSSGLCTCKAGAFLFESHRQSTFLWLFWRWSLTNCLPRLASSYDPLALGHPCS